MTALAFPVVRFCYLIVVKLVFIDHNLCLEILKNRKKLQIMLMKILHTQIELVLIMYYKILLSNFISNNSTQKGRYIIITNVHIFFCGGIGDIDFFMRYLCAHV